MMDNAASDSRSVAAMLRGTGDGREKAWLKFEKKQSKTAPLMTQEQIQAAFTKAARYGKVVNPNETIAKIKKALIATIGFILIVS